MPGKTCDTMTHSTIPALRMTDVHKRFGDNEVLRGVSLQVAPGEVIAILGSSGSGKSTLLRCINHLETIERLLLESQPGQTTDGEALNAIFRAAHSIKGSAGTFGFADIAGFTHGLENLLDRIRRGELPLTAGRISVCLKSRDVIADQLAAHRDGASAVDSGRLAEIEAALLAAHGEGADMPVPVTSSRPDGGHYLLCWDRQLGHPRRPRRRPHR